MNSLDQPSVALAKATVSVTTLAAIWPEFAAIKLLAAGDERFVPASHRYAEGVAIAKR